MKDNGNKGIEIDASNLQLLFQIKRTNLGEIMGFFNASTYIKIQQAVRTKILDLVSKIKKEIPSIVNIDIGSEDSSVSANESETVSNITQRTI